MGQKGCSRVAKQAGDLPLRRSDVPNLDALVHGARGQNTIIILAPVCGQHLVLVGRDAEGGLGLP